MLDWLHVRQPWIERSFANRHLRGGTLILYDVSSSVVEGRCRPLAAFGHNRDGKEGLGACRIYPRGVGIAMAQLCGSRQAGLSFVVFWPVLSW